MIYMKQQIHIAQLNVKTFVIKMITAIALMMFLTGKIKNYVRLMEFQCNKLVKIN